MQVMTSQNWNGKANVEIGDKFPASFVSWDDATEFCETLTEIERKAGTLKADEEYRLPTEAECACRAGTTTAYSFGDDKKQLGDYAWFRGNAFEAGEKYAHKVGLKKPNPWGLYDMYGNVWEWCSDWYGDELSSGIDPIGSGGGSGRVLRGGFWRSDPGSCRSVSRFSNVPSDRGNNLGFRVARSQSVQ